MFSLRVGGMLNAGFSESFGSTRIQRKEGMEQELNLSSVSVFVRLEKKKKGIRRGGFPERLNVLFLQNEYFNQKRIWRWPNRVTSGFPKSGSCRLKGRFPWFG
jgi:hypothetical protein